MADDIVTRLRKADYDCEVCWENQFHSLTTQAADEIVRLRAEVERLTAENAELQDGQVLNRWPLHKMLAAERALADQLAVALLGTASGRIIPTDDEWASVVKMRSAALDAWEARRG